MEALKHVESIVLIIDCTIKIHIKCLWNGMGKGISLAHTYKKWSLDTYVLVSKRNVHILHMTENVLLIDLETRIKCINVRVYKCPK